MIVASVAAGFGAALIAPLVTRWLRHRAGWLLAALPSALALYFASLLPQAASGSAAAVRLTWVEGLGLSFSLRADSLSLLMALLISGIGALVVIYAGGYLKGHAALGALYAWILAFMASMLGVVLADNLLVLFVFWELTSFTSFILIGFHHDNEQARAAALQALLVTAGGGLALLPGLVLLGMAGGTFELSELNLQAARIQSSPLFGPALALVLIGAFTKSAQFPFHFWLPNAMAAPTPVSAYLHSATMVKAGIYLLARLSPALAGGQGWAISVGGIGATTMLLGGAMALAQTDLKRLLAYSTISALGLLTLLIGIGTPHALEAAMVLLLAHALYKGALFLVAGAVEHETGTRQAPLLGGLARSMPWTAAAAGLAMLSMAGLPPLLGFISKELVYESAFELGWPLAVTIALALAFSVCVAGVVGLVPFWGRAKPLDRHPHEAPPSMTFGPLLLGGLSLAFGLAPGLIDGRLAGPAAAAALGTPVALKLSLWHGLTPALGLSAATLVLGLGLLIFIRLMRTSLHAALRPWGPERVYQAGLTALNLASRGLTQLLQSGYHRRYLTIIVLTTVAAGTFTLMRSGAFHWPEADSPPSYYELGVALLVLAAAVMAVTTSSRLGAVAAMGAAGYGVALVFLMLGAPDLAMTQFLIESLTVILFVLAFHHLPRFARLTTVSERAGDAALALAAGAMMTALVLSAVGVQLYPSVSTYYVQAAESLAHARNIVNAILVDFRGIDTLGEICVLAISAMGVFALLKMPRRKAGGAPTPEADPQAEPGR
jgi:multicomponent Na+:H+ antiporter subunit A